MEGIKGILKEGRVKGMPWVENDPNSGSGTHGFYARAWCEEGWETVGEHAQLRTAEQHLRAAVRLRAAEQHLRAAEQRTTELAT